MLQTAKFQDAVLKSLMALIQGVLYVFLGTADAASNNLRL
jgi:hypothetical protein